MGRCRRRLFNGRVAEITIADDNNNMAGRWKIRIDFNDSRLRARRAARARITATIVTLRRACAYRGLVKFGATIVVSSPRGMRVRGRALARASVRGRWRRGSLALRRWANYDCKKLNDYTLSSVAGQRAADCGANSVGRHNAAMTT